MLSTSNKSRARIAAEVYARDYPHLTSQTICIVTVPTWKAEQIVGASGREGKWAFGTQVMNLDPIRIEGPEAIRRIGNAIGRNKRLRAIFELAINIGASISFNRINGMRTQIILDCSIVETEGRSSQALAAAARWMRMEHEEAVNALMGRAQGQSPDFRIEYPEDPVECIEAVDRNFGRVAHWVYRTAKEPIVKIPSGHEAIEALRDLLGEISGKPLSKGQAKKLDQARAIVANMLKAA